MTTTEIFQITSAILVSSGIAGILIIGLSSWLGKIWANRIMESDRAKHAAELETLRADLRHSNDSDIVELKNNFEIFKEKHLRGHSDKLDTYRLVINVVLDILAHLDRTLVSGKVPPNPEEVFDNFNRGRMQAYGNLALIAPQAVMDANDALTDHLIDIVQGQAKYEWPIVRNLITNFLNTVREDIGVDVTPIEYRGSR